ncbi:uncharacterized protein LOC108088408 [Drosophila ficusphila]|uniref:uncharacterized protein LOC108088408 n=1 Tax=Drosophila ficusphila TaxID=30025 RepID=UPI0007E75CA1|nr:uncharacterized protein LOC108088408 [Drosophila ficusphila]
MSDSGEEGTGENHQSSTIEKNSPADIFWEAEEEDHVNGENEEPQEESSSPLSFKPRVTPVVPRPTVASEYASSVQSNFGEIPSPEGEPTRLTSKIRRLEYFRSGVDADCQVHVLSTCAPSDDPEGSVCYKKFGCHRIFLATASDKLEHDVYQNKQWNGVLQINGVSPESVELFLEFIYTFEITSSLVQLSMVGDIFILSCAYNMPELLLSFSEKLKEIEWPIDEIFPAFELAFRHNMFDLERILMEKIMDKANDVSQEPSLMKLQVYAFNYVIQHWLVMELVPLKDLMNLVKQYQEINEITFTNTTKFPHFSKVIKHFPNVLLDAEGNIFRF